MDFIWTIIWALGLLLLGSVFCFAGFRFFRWLLPVFGFVAGFWIGEGIITLLFDYTSTMVIVGWVVGLIVGLILAGLAYSLFKVGIVILGALFGFWLTAVITSGIGLENAVLGLLLAIVGAIIFALLVMRANLQAILVQIITALFGATLFLSGLAILLGVVTVAQFRSNTFVIQGIVESSPLWLLLWVILVLMGFVMQYRSAKDTALEQW
jgi:hypothetical protein